jgi:hypothetical protein
MAAATDMMINVRMLIMTVLIRRWTKWRNENQERDVVLSEIIWICKAPKHCLLSLQGRNDQYEHHGSHGIHIRRCLAQVRDLSILGCSQARK